MCVCVRGLQQKKSSEDCPTAAEEFRRLPDMGCGASSASKYGAVSSVLDPSLLTADAFTNEKLHG